MRCIYLRMVKQSSCDQKRYKTEGELTKKVKQWLSKQPDVFYYKSSDRYKSGIPDILACANGIFIAIELKKDGGTATPHQELFIKEVIRAGGLGSVCYTVADVSALVDEAREMR